MTDVLNVNEKNNLVAFSGGFLLYDIPTNSIVSEAENIEKMVYKLAKIKNKNLVASVVSNGKKINTHFIDSMMQNSVFTHTIIEPQALISLDFSVLLVFGGFRKLWPFYD